MEANDLEYQFLYLCTLNEERMRVYMNGMPTRLLFDQYHCNIYVAMFSE
jgi:hypothetical protein